MFLNFVLGFVLLLISNCCGVELPSFIKKCYQSDPKLNKCLQERANEVLPSFSKGIPELGVEAIDPLFLKHINSSFGSLKLDLINSTLKGLGKAHVTRFKYDKRKNTVLFKTIYDPHMTGKYKVNGKLFFLNIQGDGDYVFNLGPTNCTVTYKHKFHNKNDTRYASMEDVSLKCILGKGNIQFHNLFGGNKLLGDTVNEFLNSNFESVAKEGSQPVLDAINKDAIDKLKALYDNVPFEDILPEKPPTND